MNESQDQGNMLYSILNKYTLISYIWPSCWGVCNSWCVDEVSCPHQNDLNSSNQHPATNINNKQPAMKQFPGTSNTHWVHNKAALMHYWSILPLLTLVVLKTELTTFLTMVLATTWPREKLTWTWGTSGSVPQGPSK